MKNLHENEWVHFIEEKIAFVGITDYAQKELGEIVYVELPQVGMKVEAGDILAVVESTKAATDIYSPLSGEIIEINEKVKDEASLLNHSPEKEGWICKILLSN